MTTLAPPLLSMNPPRRLWLITFVDLVMLLLAFFALMFSMSRPDTVRFDAVAKSYAQAFGVLGGLNEVSVGPTRVPQDERAPGDDLAYLETVLKTTFAREPGLTAVQFRLTSQYLMLELPLAAPGDEGDMLDEATRDQVFKIGGVLSNLPNRIAVVVPSAAETDTWQRARRQAEVVRDALRGSGYTKPLAALVRGTDATMLPNRAQIFVMPEREPSP